MTDDGTHSGGRTAQLQRTRDRISEAALAVFDERGYRGATIAEIAARAHVGRATFYRHFTDKSALADHLALSLHPLLSAHLLAVAGVPTTADALTEWVRELVALTRSFGPLPAIVSEALVHNRSLAHTFIDSMRELSEHIVRELAQRGEFEQPDAGAVETLLIATTEAVVVAFGSDPEPNDAQMTRKLASLWLRVLT